jgi:hypothetical protein
MKITDCIDKRVLIFETSRTWNQSTVIEVKILEISPSGEWTKLMNIYGNKYWKRTKDIEIAEVLRLIEDCPL